MKGIITIAGYGTRFLPASKAIPKEMIPIAGKPLIQYHVEGLVAAGITEIIIVVRDNGDIVQSHFSPNLDLQRHLEVSGKLELLEAMKRVDRMADIVLVAKVNSASDADVQQVSETAHQINPAAAVVRDGRGLSRLSAV